MITVGKSRPTKLPLKVEIKVEGSVGKKQSTERLSVLQTLASWKGIPVSEMAEGLLQMQERQITGMLQDCAAACLPNA